MPKTKTSTTTFSAQAIKEAAGLRDRLVDGLKYAFDIDPNVGLRVMHRALRLSLPAETSEIKRVSR
jgi:hypothetical protein